MNCTVSARCLSRYARDCDTSLCAADLLQGYLAVGGASDFLQVIRIEPDGSIAAVQKLVEKRKQGSTITKISWNQLTCELTALTSKRTASTWTPDDPTHPKRWEQDAFLTQRAANVHELDWTADGKSVVAGCLDNQQYTVRAGASLEKLTESKSVVGGAKFCRPSYDGQQVLLVDKGKGTAAIVPLIEPTDGSKGFEMQILIQTELVDWWTQPNGMQLVTKPIGEGFDLCIATKENMFMLVNTFTSREQGIKSAMNMSSITAIKWSITGRLLAVGGVAADLEGNVINVFSCDGQQLAALVLPRPTADIPFMNLTGLVWSANDAFLFCTAGKTLFRFACSTGSHFLHGVSAKETVFMARFYSPSASEMCLLTLKRGIPVARFFSDQLNEIGEPILLACSKEGIIMVGFRSGNGTKFCFFGLEAVDDHGAGFESCRHELLGSYDFPTVPNHCAISSNTVLIQCKLYMVALTLAVTSTSVQVHQAIVYNCVPATAMLPLSIPLSAFDFNDDQNKDYSICCSFINEGTIFLAWSNGVVGRNNGKHWSLSYAFDALQVMAPDQSGQYLAFIDQNNTFGVSFLMDNEGEVVELDALVVIEHASHFLWADDEQGLLVVMSFMELHFFNVSDLQISKIACSSTSVPMRFGKLEVEMFVHDRMTMDDKDAGYALQLKMPILETVLALLDAGSKDEAADIVAGCSMLSFLKVVLANHVQQQPPKPGDDQAGLRDEDFQRALQLGKKAWGRSKIMIVGEGRAGKTALANSIMGRNFVNTDSTVGINQLTCDIKYAAVNENRWGEYIKPQKELEAALAQMLTNEKMNRPAKADVNFFGLDAEPNADQGCMDEAGAGVGFVATDIPQPHSAITVVGAHSTNSVQQIAETGTLPYVAAVRVNVGDIQAETLREAESRPGALTTVSAITLDNELIMKCLADKIHTDSKFIVSLFDFGGQSVFNVIHHFFLTKCGVYLLVFNMEWMVSNNHSEKQSCLAYLSFWLNSIIIHTQDADGHIAPVVLVGTRKDKVPQMEQHLSISSLLFNEFKSSVAWRDLIENEGIQTDSGKMDLCFFPVDNTSGRHDPTMAKLMKCIEAAIDASAYVHAEQPLSWLQALDMINAHEQSYLTYDSVQAMAASCNIPQAMVPKFLRFLHEMGALMWHEEDELKDVVIMNPISYFVTPATVVICKHTPTADDNVCHSLDIHKKVRKQHMSDWEEMTGKGIISQALLHALLESADEKERIVQLMLKYGLLVRLSALESGNQLSSSQSSYLAPALLPCRQLADFSTPPATDSEPACWPLGNAETTFYFLFTASKELERHTIINWQDCQQYGFLPSGLFERLICKAISWTHATTLASDAVQISSLFKDEAILSFGLQRFRLVALMRQNMIRVEVEGKSPLGVHARLRNLIEKIISECMESLKFLTVLLFRAADPTNSANIFVRLDQVRQAAKRHSALNLMGSSGRSLLSDQEVNDLYGAWLTEFQTFDSYDVFISYRWGVHDSSFTQALFDILTLFTVGSERRAVRVFLDSQRLRKGRNFQAEFTTALVNSKALCPIISADSLVKLQDHNPDKEDNMLVEWIMAIACSEHSSNTKERIVLPIVFGSIDANGVIGDFFAENLLAKVSSAKPKKSMELAAALLAEHGIPLSPKLQQLSVQDIVQTLVKFLCVSTWLLDASSPQLFVNEVAQTIVENVEQCLAHHQPQAKQTIVHAAADAVNVADLTVSQVCRMLNCIGLGQYVLDFTANEIDGAALLCCETVDDLKEIGMAKGVHAKKLLKFIAEWKIAGIPIDQLT